MDWWHDRDIKIQSKNVNNYVLKIFDYIKKHYLFNYVNTCVTLWVPIKKDDEETYKKYCHYDEEEYYDKYEDIPDIIWVKLLFVYGPEDVVMVVNEKEYYISLKDKSDCVYEDRYYLKYFGYLKKQIKIVTKIIEEGKYESLLEKELPYRYRFGTIFKQDLWKLDKKYKKNNNGKITNKLINEFKKVYLSKIENKKMQDVTFNDYFKMAITFYKAIQYEMDDNKSLFKIFERYGEDFGGRLLYELDHNSKDDFLKYLNELEYTRGGHPWGIIRGSSRSRVSLFPEKDEDGFYFELSGNYTYRSYEMMIAYISLISNGYPVTISCYEDIINYVTGNEYLGFVPSYVLPFYCSDYFSKRVNDFVWLGDNEELIPYIEWDKIDRPILINDDVTINFKKETVVGMVNYLDKATRFMMGQFINCFPFGYNCKELEMISSFATGLPINSFFSIYSDKTHMDAKICYDLLQIFRYQLYLDDKEKYKNTYYANEILNASKLKDATLKIDNDKFVFKCKATTIDFIVNSLEMVAHVEKGEIKEIIAAINKYFKDKSISDELLEDYLNDLYKDYDGSTKAYSILFEVEKEL